MRVLLLFIALGLGLIVFGLFFAKGQWRLNLVVVGASFVAGAGWILRSVIVDG